MRDPALAPDGADEQFWYDFLTKGHTVERRLRAVFSHLPHEPRCRLCAAPFAGPAAPVMRLIGKGQAPKNPTTCAQCYTFLSTNRGGAEIEASMLFADIRGSTTIAESTSPSAFRSLLDRFYTTASRVVFDHDGTIEKFVGDELVAIFVPLFSGNDTTQRKPSGPPRGSCGRPGTVTQADPGCRSERAFTPGSRGMAPSARVTSSS